MNLIIVKSALYLTRHKMKFHNTFCLIFLSSVAVALAAYSKNVANMQLFERGITEFVSTGNQTDSFLEAAKTFPMPGLLLRDHSPSQFQVFGECTMCSILTNRIVADRKNGATREEMMDKLATMCSTFHIENERVCQGFIRLNVDAFLYIIDNGKNVGNRFCAIALQDAHCKYNDAVFEWEIKIPSGKTVEKKEFSGSGDKFGVLHLSDYHYDPLYTPGVTYKCGEPMCCQSDQKKADTEEDACGYWSTYQDADAGWHLIEEVFKQTNKHNFDYVYFTGDIMSHRVWETSRVRNTRSIKEILGGMKTYYNVPVYPVLGNHESNPMNQWPAQISQTNVSEQWLYDLVAEEWSTWLGEEAKSTIRKGGFYTVSPRPGFRIIALNSNVCYSYNWWLVYDDVDPNGQLQWLADTLLKAEQNDESVHILSHVPSGSDGCLKVWSREYGKILERFANTVTGQFNGHTHYDEFNVIYNKSDETQAIGASFNGASVTTYINNNPSYKVFQVDSGSFKLLDYEEWTFNLTQANANPNEPIDWFKLYDFTTAYGAENLDASEVANVVAKMAKNHTLINQYYGFKFRWADPALAVPCDENCQKDLLCTIVTSEFGENLPCENIKKIYNLHR